MRILVAEDEPKLASFIKKGLEENNCSVDVVHDGYTARQRAGEQDYDVIILDIMLPFNNGIDICRTLRRNGIRTPICMLSAMATVDDRIAGLESGADDYLTKPFHFRELLARVRALTRRHSQPEPEEIILSFADLQLDKAAKTARRAGKNITLTAREYALLEVFMRQPNKMLSKTYLAERVWGIDFDQGTNIVEVYINYLRNKMEKGGQRRLIHTMIGMGYILKDEA